jgi:hypothetical protein
MLQQPGTALGAGIGDIRAIGEHLPLRLVCDTQFCQLLRSFWYTCRHG